MAHAQPPMARKRHAHNVPAPPHRWCGEVVKASRTVATINGAHALQNCAPWKKAMVKNWPCNIIADSFSRLFEPSLLRCTVIPFHLYAECGGGGVRFM